MAVEMATMASNMAKPKKSPGKAERHSGKRLVIWLDLPYHGRLEELIAKTRRTKTTEVKIALEKHFRDEGLPLAKE